MKSRQELVEIEQKMHFSYDLEATLTEEERLVNDTLNLMRAEFKNDKNNTIIHDYFANYVTKLSVF